VVIDEVWLQDDRKTSIAATDTNDAIRTVYLKVLRIIPLLPYLYLKLKYQGKI
jgi:hypothetical protein